MSFNSNQLNSIIMCFMSANNIIWQHWGQCIYCFLYQFLMQPSFYELKPAINCIIIISNVLLKNTILWSIMLYWNVISKFNIIFIIQNILYKQTLSKVANIMFAYQRCHYISLCTLKTPQWSLWRISIFKSLLEKLVMP